MKFIIKITVLLALLNLALDEIFIEIENWFKFPAELQRQLSLTLLTDKASFQMP